MAFKCLDCECESKLPYNDLFSLYKSLCYGWLPEERILQMVFKTLSVPTVQNVPELTWPDFSQVFLFFFFAFLKISGK